MLLNMITNVQTTGIILVSLIHIHEEKDFLLGNIKNTTNKEIINAWKSVHEMAQALPKSN